MDRFARLIIDAPRHVVTLALLAALACIWMLDTGFASSVHLADTGEELYLASSSPLSLVLADLAAECPGGFALAPGRPVHLHTAQRFVTTAALGAAQDPASEEFLVRLYMFASELVSECERRRVDPAGLHRALDTMASALRAGFAAQDAVAAAASEEPPAAVEPPAAEEIQATLVAEVPEPAPAPEPAPVAAPRAKGKAPAAKKEAPVATAEKPRASEGAKAKEAPAAKRAQAPAEDAESVRAASAPRQIASALSDEFVPPDRILRAGDRIVESLSIDLGFLVR